LIEAGGVIQGVPGQRKPMTADTDASKR